MRQHANSCRNDTPPRLIPRPFFPKGALRARCAGQSFVPRMPKVPAGQHWRTLDRQPTAYQLHGVHHLRIGVAKQKGDARKLWKEVRSTGCKPGGWVTEAAALAARSQFKHWVDYEMNAPKRAAQSEASASRSPARRDPEMAGKGIEYCWGKSKQKFRRDVNDRVQAHLHANIVKSFSRSDKFLPLSRIRKYLPARRALIAVRIVTVSLTP